MPELFLNDLQYADTRAGRFCLYRSNDGQHGLPIRFSVPKDPAGALGPEAARGSALAWQALGLEVRVVDSGDCVVFHAKNGRIVYPRQGDFWAEVEG